MDQKKLAILTADRINKVSSNKKMYGCFAGWQKKVAVITRWLYYWGGHKAGICCILVSFSFRIEKTNVALYVDFVGCSGCWKNWIQSLESFPFKACGCHSWWNWQNSHASWFQSIVPWSSIRNNSVSCLWRCWTCKYDLQCTTVWLPKINFSFSLERFSYDLEMKTREQNRNNKRTELERFDWFIERAWLLVG